VKAVAAAELAKLLEREVVKPAALEQRMAEWASLQVRQARQLAEQLEAALPLERAVAPLLKEAPQMAAPSSIVRANKCAW